MCQATGSPRLPKQLWQLMLFPPWLPAPFLLPEVTVSEAEAGMQHVSAPQCTPWQLTQASASTVWISLPGPAQNSLGADAHSGSHFTASPRITPRDRDVIRTCRAFWQAYGLCKVTTVLGTPWLYPPAPSPGELPRKALCFTICI